MVAKGKLSKVHADYRMKGSSKSSKPSKLPHPSHPSLSYPSHGGQAKGCPMKGSMLLGGHGNSEAKPSRAGTGGGSYGIG